MQLLGDALALAEPEGFIRIFVDEGMPMAQLLSEAAAQGIMPDYVGKLLAAFELSSRRRKDKSSLPSAQPLDRAIEPTRVGSTTAHCPGTLKRRDWQTAFPRPGHS